MLNNRRKMNCDDESSPSASSTEKLPRLLSNSVSPLKKSGTDTFDSFKIEPAGEDSSRLHQGKAVDKDSHGIERVLEANEENSNRTSTTFPKKRRYKGNNNSKQFPRPPRSTTTTQRGDYLNNATKKNTDSKKKWRNKPRIKFSLMSPLRMFSFNRNARCFGNASMKTRLLTHMATVLLYSLLFNLFLRPVSAEEEEGPPSATTLSVSMMLCGSMTFVMAMFYLVLVFQKEICLCDF